MEKQKLLRKEVKRLKQDVYGDKMRPLAAAWIIHLYNPMSSF